MQTTQETAITQKTKELCQAILDQPDLRSARQRIETFMSNEVARSQYEGLMTKGEALQQKQRTSQPLSEIEIQDFEKHRDEVLANPVARGFLDAQEELHNVHHSINRYVSKTLELGRVPSDDDLNPGECGSGCGCGHEH